MSRGMARRACERGAGCWVGRARSMDPLSDRGVQPSGPGRISTTPSTRGGLASPLPPLGQCRQDGLYLVLAFSRGRDSNQLGRDQPHQAK